MRRFVFVMHVWLFSGRYKSPLTLCKKIDTDVDSINVIEEKIRESCETLGGYSGKMFILNPSNNRRLLFDIMRDTSKPEIYFTLRFTESSCEERITFKLAEVIDYINQYLSGNTNI